MLKKKKNKRTLSLQVRPSSRKIGCRSSVNVRLFFFNLLFLMYMSFKNAQASDWITFNIFLTSLTRNIHPDPFLIQF